MIKRIFNIKNWFRAIVFGMLTFILYVLVDVIFDDEINVKSNFIRSIIMFVVFFLLGSQDITWKQLFSGKKNQ